MSNAQTPVFRVSYPNVLKPKRNDLSGQDEYSVVALFPKGADLSGLRKAAQEAIEEKWGDDKKKWPKNLRTPFRKQDEKATQDEEGRTVYPPGMEEGGIFLNLKSKQRPGVVDQKVKDITNDYDFYPGCYARASVRAYAYEQKGNTGVAFGLKNIQKVKEGDPLGSRTKPQDDFAPIETTAEAGASGGDTNDIFG